MSHNTPAPYSSNSGLAKGAAVAAIAYHGLLLLLSESIVLFAGSFLSVKLRESDTDLSSSLGGMGISLLVLLGVVFLLAFGIPLALAIWMLVAARRNHPRAGPRGARHLLGLRRDLPHHEADEAHLGLE